MSEATTRDQMGVGSMVVRPENSFLKRIVVVIGAVLAILSCQPTVKSIQFKPTGVTKEPGCALDVVIAPETVNYSIEVIGELSVMMEGTETNCGWDNILLLFKEDACRAGADGMLLYDIYRYVGVLGIPTDCYNARARLFVSASPPIAPSPREDRYMPPAVKAVVSGTGWVTDSGYIVTANHIVADADRISVVSTDGQSYNATVAVADKVNDIAVLSVGPEFPRAGGLQLASATARPAASVLALGYPLPDIMGSTLKVTTGTISSVYGFRNDPRTYQFSAQIQSGNSGGPLLNLQGEVIGVVTAKLNAATVFEWTGDLPDSVSYAVKSAYLQPLLDSLLQIVTNTRPPAADKSPEEVAELAAPFVVMVIATPPR